MKMKGLCRRLCGVQPVRVIHGSGQVLYLSPNITVEEVLHHYPHNFLCQPGLNSYSGWRSNQMLALDTHLQSGCIYFMFPLPRLFPTAPSLSSQQSCRCFQHNPSSSSSLLLYDSPRKAEPGHESKWGLRLCCSKNCKSQVSPELNLYSAGKNLVRTNSLIPIPWRPRLGCISEEADLDACLEDVTQLCGPFWRKDQLSC